MTLAKEYQIHILIKHVKARHQDSEMEYHALS